MQCEVPPSVISWDCPTRLQVRSHIVSIVVRHLHGSHTSSVHSSISLSALIKRSMGVVERLVEDEAKLMLGQSLLTAAL